MKYLEKIKKVQIELSNFCNANCIGCRRTDPNTLTDRYSIACQPITFISLEIIEKIFLDRLLSELEEVHFCGTIDEPLAHPEFLEILKIIQKVKKNITIRIDTNGSIRNQKFYKELSNILKGFSNHDLQFSIDGLEESHRLYRGDIDYNKIINNAKEFIDSGGNASWQMIVFPWNSHELHECKNLAKELNFKKFISRKDRTEASNYKKEKILSLRKANTPATEEIPAKNLEEKIKRKYKHGLTINCHFQNEEMIFINYSSKVFPCCFLASTMQFYNSEARLQFEKNIYSMYDKNFNDLHFYTLSEILNSNWFANDLVNSWKNNQLLTCQRTCGSCNLTHVQHNMEIL